MKLNEKTKRFVDLTTRLSVKASSSDGLIHVDMRPNTRPQLSIPDDYRTRYSPDGMGRQLSAVFTKAFAGKRRGIELALEKSFGKLEDHRKDTDIIAQRKLASTTTESSSPDGTVVVQCHGAQRFEVTLNERTFGRHSAEALTEQVMSAINRVCQEQKRIEHRA